MPNLTHTFPGLQGPIWEANCPTTWPSSLIGVGVSITILFRPSARANCSNTTFAASAALISATAAAALNNATVAFGAATKDKRSATVSSTTVGSCQVRCCHPYNASTCIACVELRMRLAAVWRVRRARFLAGCCASTSTRQLSSARKCHALAERLSVLAGAAN